MSNYKIGRENLSWYEKYHTALMIALGILFLVAFIFFVKFFFKTDPQNQAGKIFTDKQGETVVIEKTEKFSAGDRELELKTSRDDLVYGTYTIGGMVGDFEGRYSEDKTMLYTTMEYIKDGKSVVEEMIFRVNKDGTIGVGLGEKYLGKNGIDIYRDVKKTDFSSIILKKK